MELVEKQQKGDFMNKKDETSVLPKNLKFIYGAGRYGKLLLQSFMDLMEINYFVQTEEPIEKELEGIPVISFERMKNMEGEKIVFIAIGNKRIAQEIKNNIYNTNIKNIKVYLCGKFIEDNFLMKGKNHLTGNKYCIVCNNYFNEFLPAGIKEEVFDKYHIIGGGYRENCKCPYCGVSDRARWFFYFLHNILNISEISGRILHFAPEKGVAEYIKQNTNIDYYTGDIVVGRAMHMTDILDIQYKDDTFDYVISNHVMEHITDEEKAVSEIKRVLKKNGKWIFSFPICTDITTYEDPTIISPEARLKAYGHSDHVRLYGNDYKARFENYGLELQIYSPEKKLEAVDIKKYGFIKDDVIIVATKISNL